MHTRQSRPRLQRATHLHIHTSSGQSPTLQPLWSIILSYQLLIITAPRASDLSPTHTRTPVIHSITLTIPLMVCTFPHVSRNSQQWPSSTHRYKEREPLLHLTDFWSTLLHVILCHWPCCFLGKWNFINQYWKAQNNAVLRGRSLSLTSCQIW